MKPNYSPESVLEQAAESAVKLIENAAAENVKIIANAAEKAAQTISNSAMAATRVVADDAEHASRMLNIKNTAGGSDHDFLLTFSAEVKTKLNQIGDDIKELKTGTSSRISALETDKLNIKDSYPVLYKEAMETKVSDHELRIRSNERNIIRIMTFGTVIMLLIGVAEVLLSIFIKNGRL